jgi:plastocyanin
MTRGRMAAAALAAFAGATVCLGSQAAPGGVVRGTVTVTGGRTNADVVVSLLAPGLEVKPPRAPREIDQKGLQFKPHVLAVVRGTTVRFLNSDAEDHNVYSPEGGYNLGTWAPGQTRDQVFDTVGVYTQLCRVHPDMEAFVVVLDTPYFAVTDAAGRFEIRNVAPGTYALRTWGKRLKPADRSVTVTSGTPATVDLTVGR